MVVALAPIPLGSNRPALWSLWAVGIGLLAAAYGLAQLHAPASLSLRRYWPEATLFLALLAWLCLQSLPIGAGPLTHVALPETSAAGISLDPGSTRLAALTFATYGVLFLLTSQAVADSRAAHAMLVALFAVIAGYAIYGLVNLTQLGDTLLGAEKSWYGGYATGTFVNRNAFATFLAAGLAIGVPLLAASTARRDAPARWLHPALVLLGLLFIAAALLATGSRMGAVAGGTGVLLGLALSLRRQSKAPVWFALVALAAVAAVLALYGAGTLERLLLGHDDATRGELYRQVWAAIWQRPWTGYGGGSFAAVFPLFQHAPLPGDVVWDRAHSTYLALWFELGLGFGTVPLLLVAGLARRAVFGLRDPASRPVAAAALAVTAVFAVHALVDFSAEIMANAFLLTAVLALGARAGRR
jgi:O-antigen ligase